MLGNSVRLLPLTMFSVWSNKAIIVKSKTSSSKPRFIASSKSELDWNYWILKFIISAVNINEDIMHILFIDSAFCKL